MKLKLPVFFFNFALTLLLGEFVLRFLFGIQPGIILKTGSFHKVNKLKQLNGLYADSNGIFKATQSAAQDIVAKLQHDSYLRLIINHIFKERNNEIETKSLIWDFALSKKDENNPLSIYLNRLGQNLPHGLSDFDSAIIYYAMHPINAEGFKSIPFKQYKGKKKILMLGDSFTWGHSASHKTRSFADLLLYRGYAVYNTGISGADPAQYLAVAQKYIPLLKPDIVVVNFYMGNDIAYFKRELKPGVPIFYSTNAGQLFSCNDGVAFDTPEKAYAFVLKHYSIPEENNTFNYICAKSSMGTLLWKILNDYHKVDSHNNTDTLYYKEVQSLRQPRPYSNI
ncbi:MAG: hypothetical protein JWO06_3134, partial [Bacteroidota bacterium]|nr:hypothetical protein [Bacteroidota bacterium]